eukprot:jgi/Mesvir1/3219/Mv16368-RA.1
MFASSPYLYARPEFQRREAANFEEFDEAGDGVGRGEAKVMRCFIRLLNEWGWSKVPRVEGEFHNPYLARGKDHVLAYRATREDKKKRGKKLDASSAAHRDKLQCLEHELAAVKADNAAIKADLDKTKAMVEEQSRAFQEQSRLVNGLLRNQEVLQLQLQPFGEHDHEEELRELEVWAQRAQRARQRCQGDGQRSGQLEQRLGSQQHQLQHFAREVAQNMDVVALADKMERVIAAYGEQRGTATGGKRGQGDLPPAGEPLLASGAPNPKRARLSGEATPLAPPSIPSGVGDMGTGRHPPPFPPIPSFPPSPPVPPNNQSPSATVLQDLAPVNGDPSNSGFDAAGVSVALPVVSGTGYLAEGGVGGGMDAGASTTMQVSVPQPSSPFDTFLPPNYLSSLFADEAGASGTMDEWSLVLIAHSSPHGGQVGMEVPFRAADDDLFGSLNDDTLLCAENVWYSRPCGAGTSGVTTYGDFYKN